jgi:hypothetical protein
VVLDQHVGPLDEAKQLLASTRRPQIQGDAALVGVEEVEETALLGMRLVVGERAPLSGGVSVFGRLDLDDVGTVVGEQLGAVGRRDHLTEFQDLDPLESGVGHFPSIPWNARAASIREAWLPLAELFEEGKARRRELETAAKSLWKVARILSITESGRAARKSRRCTAVVLLSRIGSADRTLRISRARLLAAPSESATAGHERAAVRQR